MQQQSKNGFLPPEETVTSSKAEDGVGSSSDYGDPVRRKVANHDEAGYAKEQPQLSLNKSDQEIVRLIGQHLNNIGLSQTVEKLMNESGCALDHPAASRFHRHVLSGHWPEAEHDLEDLKSFLLDGNTLMEMKFLLLKEKYLEFLEDKKYLEALQVLRQEIGPLNQIQDQINGLSLLMMASGPEDLRRRAQWEGKGKISRTRLMDRLQVFLPPSIMLPPRRLQTLLGQALENQQRNCKYHNTRVTCELGAFSMLTDHECSREQFPCETVQILAEHCDEVIYCKFSEDGSKLATGSKDSTVIIWNVDPETRTLQYSMTLDGHTLGVSHIAWSPKGDYLVVCGGGGADCDSPDVWIWNVEKGILETRSSNSADDCITCASFSPDGTKFVCGGIRGQFYLCDTQGIVQEHWEGVRVQYCHWKTDGRVLAADTHKRIRSYNFHDSTDFTVIQEEPLNDIMSFSVDRTGRNCILNIRNKGIHWWDLEDRVLIRKFQGVTQGFFMNHSCWGGVNDDFIASGSEDNKVYIFHKSSEQPLMRLSGHTRNVNCVTWNPKYPDMLVSASDDGTLRVWGPAEEYRSRGEDGLVTAQSLTEPS